MSHHGGSNRDDTLVDRAPGLDLWRDDAPTTVVRRIVVPGTREGSRKGNRGSAGQSASGRPGRQGAVTPPIREGSHAEAVPRGFEVGGDDAFIFAWGRSNAAARKVGRLLNVALALAAVLGVAVVWLAWRNEQKETYVFVRDALGNVVQADARSFLQVGIVR